MSVFEGTTSVMHGGTADTGALNERDVSTELGSGKGCLVAARATPEYRDPLFALELVGHYSILAVWNTVPQNAPGHRIRSSARF